jgi:hypothetical protein
MREMIGKIRKRLVSHFYQLVGGECSGCETIGVPHSFPVSWNKRADRIPRESDRLSEETEWTVSERVPFRFQSAVMSAEQKVQIKRLEKSSVSRKAVKSDLRFERNSG